MIMITFRATIGHLRMNTKMSTTIKMNMKRKVQVLGRSIWRKSLQRDRRRYLN
jgi:hypothetical protein